MRPKACLATICAAALALGLSSGAGSAYTYRKLYDFCSKFACADGANPGAGLLADAGGNLYGTTISGGGESPSAGTVFELSYDTGRQAWKYRRLHAFCHRISCDDGNAPRTALIMDVAGNLYGETTGSYLSECGTVFELQPRGADKQPSFVLLHAFPNVFECPQGGVPIGALSYAGKSSGLPYDGTSPLYGTAEVGGTNGGLVFSLTPSGSSWTYSDIYDFCSAKHCIASPPAEVTVSPDGNLLGTAQETFGESHGGAIYELSPGSPQWSEQVLYAFCGKKECRNGYYPQSNLVPDATGAYFGTTPYGGTPRQGCCGTLYKLTPQGTNWAYAVVYDFCSLRDCKDGAAPAGSLFMDSTGALYGATQGGGGHNGIGVSGGGGTIFRWNGTSLETLYAFCAGGGSCEDGRQPNGVTMDASGNLFGTTYFGGKFGAGVVFELMP